MLNICCPGKLSTCWRSQNEGVARRDDSLTKVKEAAVSISNSGSRGCEGTYHDGDRLDCFGISAEDVGSIGNIRLS